MVRYFLPFLKRNEVIWPWLTILNPNRLLYNDLCTVIVAKSSYIGQIRDHTKIRPGLMRLDV
jgi:hypothetical protein